MADPFQQHFGRSFEALAGDPELKALLANPNVSQRRDSCTHGGPSPSPERMVATAELMEATVAAADVAAELRVAMAWVQRHPSAASRDDTARILTGMATDAVLAEDWAPARQFARQAEAVRALSSAAVTAGDSAELARFTQRHHAEWAGISDWAVRRRLARANGCGCLGRMAEASCALASCGAPHDPDVPGGATLRACVRCKRALYCCVEHQQADWARHKKADCEKKKKPAA